MHEDNDFPADEKPASLSDTVTQLVKRTKRKKAVPVRREFVQQGRAKDVRPGPLAKLVRAGDPLALRAYLFTLLMASSHPWDVTLDSGVWARMLGLEDREQAAARSAVSKALGRLKRDGLVRTARAGRKSVVFPLHEAGRREEYVAPDGGIGNRYFQLPLKFWTEGWHQELRLPGIAMLLVGLTQQSAFWIPAEKVPGWYGWSSATANRGYAELEQHGLLKGKNVRISDGLAAGGLQVKYMRRLQGSFKPVSTRRAALVTPPVPGSVIVPDIQASAAS